MKVEAEKRFALLLAAKDSDYVRKVYGGYFNVFVEAFGEGEETWDMFRVVEGEFPDVAELDKYDGFVVSGSPHDAYGDELWILQLCFLLQTLDAMKKKVLGVCFGHQALCRALGGLVGKARTGWDVGIRKLCMVEDLPPCKYLNGLREIPPPCPLIIECHQDEVLEVPEGAEVIAFSEKTAVEMFRIGDHILGIQGHPEYTKDILYNLIDRLVSNHSIENMLESTGVTLPRMPRPVWRPQSLTGRSGRRCAGTSSKAGKVSLRTESDALRRCSLASILVLYIFEQRVTLCEGAL